MTKFCDFSKLALGWRPNQFLMLPSGFEATAKAHEVSPDFPAPPVAVYDKLLAIIGNEPRIEWLAKDADGYRLELVQRSKTFRFPDRISIAILPGNTEKSATMAVYGRAKVGIRDFGVNKARIRGWVSDRKSVV